MGGWLRQIALNAQLRAGLSGSIAIWAAVAAAALPVAFVCFVVAAFVWLSHRYGAVIAGLILGTAFLVVALAAIVACMIARRRNIERARLELETRRSTNANLLDPKFIAIGYQIGQAIGWRKLISLAAVGLVAAGLAREWLGRPQGTTQSKSGEDNPD
jgi:hypothetical protein